MLGFSHLPEIVMAKSTLPFRYPIFFEMPLNNAREELPSREISYSLPISRPPLTLNEVESFLIVNAVKENFLLSTKRCISESFKKVCPKSESIKWFISGEEVMFHLYS